MIFDGQHTIARRGIFTDNKQGKYPTMYGKILYKLKYYDFAPYK